MSEAKRFFPSLTCNKCHTVFKPYPFAPYAPMLDEVVCPNCGEKRILYFGDDPSITKMILSNYGVNKEMNDRLNELQERMGAIEKRMDTSVAEARNIMTKAFINALKKEIEEHEQAFHNVGGKFGKQAKQ
jgi:hypothetical protein